jgi:DNA-binding transcriptional MerR regulator
MERKMREYSVNELAKLAGVSVRTLHHYDQIGLLSAAKRSPAGYRQYGEADLLRLQQILFYKELDVPLADIKKLLDRRDFDPVLALHSHRENLQARVERLQTLLKTIDKTINQLMEDKMTLTDDELYEGFTREERQQLERYEMDAEAMYDPTLVKLANTRIRRMSREQWQAVKEEGDRVTRLLANLADRDPSDPQVQEVVAVHHAWIENFYPASAEVYRGLGEGYATHPDFRAFYDRYRPNLADFMREAMVYFAEHTLTGK